MFGPRPRDHSYAIHRKQRRLAVRSALLSKFLDGQVLVVDDLEVKEPKTKLVHAALRALGIERSCLIGTKGIDKILVLGARNIPGVQVAPVGDFNALDLLRVQTVLLTRDGFDDLASRFSLLGGESDQPAGEMTAGGEAEGLPGDEAAESAEAESVREPQQPGEAVVEDEPPKDSATDGETPGTPETEKPGSETRGGEA